MTRKPGRLKRRSRIKPVSDKRRKRNAEAKPIRRDLVAEAGCCDICQVPTVDLCCHEIAQAGLRSIAFTEQYAILILCNGCHKHIREQPKIWSKARQAALLKIRRPQCFNLDRLNALLIAKLDAEEIDVAVRSIENPKWFDYGGRRTA